MKETSYPCSHCSQPLFLNMIEKASAKCEVQAGGGGQFWFQWQNFVERLGKFPSYFIQSKTNASAHEYSESIGANKFVMVSSCCLATLETNIAGSVNCRHQLALFSRQKVKEWEGVGFVLAWNPVLRVCFYAFNDRNKIPRVSFCHLCLTGSRNTQLVKRRRTQVIQVCLQRTNGTRPQRLLHQ